MFEPFTDVVPSIFGTLNQYPMLLTLVLHTIIVLPMIWIYKGEKKRLEEEK
ncbi:MAG: hypothetical protein K0U47_04875 [Epsilonproteobacteria bacterium]|nr:hypothetical protein [Campylobacterota bacterium]